MFQNECKRIWSNNKIRVQLVTANWRHKVDIAEQKICVRGTILMTQTDTIIKHNTFKLYWNKSKTHIFRFNLHMHCKAEYAFQVFSLCCERIIVLFVFERLSFYLRRLMFGSNVYTRHLNRFYTWIFRVDVFKWMNECMAKPALCDHWALPIF